ncbi:MAG: hypothetical protein A3K03_10145 [Bdellovibrionales bacterium RIFOXYD1_FULL_44_7]|nr:MAG: hypothetical protein A3K03_10145 [Bdellovibrionales bacterium RIFOXYD1_FULL_44_7]
MFLEDRTYPVKVEVRRNRAESLWSYSLLDKRQREIAEKVKQGDKGVLLLSEVAPVITLGRRTPRTDIFATEEALRARGVEVLRVDRGGLATYHGPGQWVVFVVDSLENLTGDSRGVRLAVEGLLNIALKVAGQYQAKAEIRDGKTTGVWGPSGKIASVGVHIEKRVLLHGLAINGFRTKESFFGIRPCGTDASPEFLLSDASQSSDFEELGLMIVEQVFKQFWK